MKSQRRSSTTARDIALKPPKCIVAAEIAAEKVRWHSMSLKSRQILHLSYCVGLAITICVQSTIMNILFIHYDSANLGKHVVWFCADTVSVCLFMVALNNSYQYLLQVHYGDELRKRLPPEERAAVEASDTSSTDKWLFNLGVLPLSYISWLVYSCVLLAKVITFIGHDVIYEMPNDLTGLQTLIGALLLSAFTYFFLIEGHTWTAHGTQRRLYVTMSWICTAFDLLDTVKFLETVYEYNMSPMEKMHGVILGHIEVYAIGLSCVSFLLPAIPLYIMSMTERKALVIELPLSTINELLHLLLSDLLHLGVRVVFWSHGNSSVANMIVKNAFFVLMYLLNFVPDIREMWHRMRYIHRESIKHIIRRRRRYAMEGSQHRNASPQAEKTKRASGSERDKADTDTAKHEASRARHRRRSKSLPAEENRKHKASEL